MKGFIYTRLHIITNDKANMKKLVRTVKQMRINLYICLIYDRILLSFFLKKNIETRLLL